MDIELGDQNYTLISVAYNVTMTSTTCWTAAAQKFHYTSPSIGTGQDIQAGDRFHALRGCIG